MAFRLDQLEMVKSISQYCMCSFYLFWESSLETELVIGSSWMHPILSDSSINKSETIGWPLERSVALKAIDSFEDVTKNHPKEHRAHGLKRKSLKGSIWAAFRPIFNWFYILVGKRLALSCESSNAMNAENGQHIGAISSNCSDLISSFFFVAQTLKSYTCMRNMFSEENIGQNEGEVKNQQNQRNNHTMKRKYRNVKFVDVRSIWNHVFCRFSAHDKLE